MAVSDENTNFILSPHQIESFNRDGILLIKDFYNLDKEITPILESIYNIISLLIDEHDLSIHQLPFSNETFDSGYQELINYNRKLGGIVYDAIKQIPAYIRLVCSWKHEAIINQLRNTDFSGIAAGGYGIRINNPFEDEYRADWHQEYPAQLRSIDGVVFLSPLIEVTNSMGPTRFCLESHKEGVLPVYSKNSQTVPKTAYSLKIKNLDYFLDKYKIVSPLLSPGDTTIVDFKTIHSSGHNVSNRSLWSMQIRYFNFNDGIGKKIGWCGSFAADVDFAKIHPELFLE